MSIRSFTLSHRPRTTRLAASLAVALGVILSAGSAERAFAEAPRGQDRLLDLPSYLHGKAAPANDTHRQTPVLRAPTPRVVTTCDDDINNPNSLRAQVAAAMSDDVIDLSTLACSKITLDQAQGAISVLQDSLYLKGPATGAAGLTIDGGNQSAVFNHFGAGTLALSDLTIANGYYESINFPVGGCIYSTGDVDMIRSVVSHCTLIGSSNSVSARGAGVYTLGGLTLSGSTITDSHAFTQNGAKSYGGGVSVLGHFHALYSTISNNTSVALGNAFGYAGGVWAKGNTDIEGSTISGNRADFIGALALFGDAASNTAMIINSTISSNTGTVEYGGMWTRVPLTLANSTVAFNRSPFGLGTKSDGVYTEVALNLQSSIIADNASSAGPRDLGGQSGIVNTGADNVITSSTLNPLPGTISACPQLEPLANNGGGTLTHALRHTSPAIDQGDAGSLFHDQRFAPRIAGAQADIGSVEWQPGETDERIFVSGFDGLCDQ